MSEDKEPTSAEPTDNQKEEATAAEATAASAEASTDGPETSAATEAQDDASAAPASDAPDEAMAEPDGEADATAIVDGEAVDGEAGDGQTGRGRSRRLFRLRGRFRREGRERKPRGPRRRRLQPRPPTDFRRELITIPNILTYIRIGMLPLILLALDRDNRWSSFVAGCFFSAACFTDFFDGYFARKFNQVTVLGKLLDPLADKLIVSATLIVMIPMGRVPSWLVIILLAREFAITGLRGIAASEDMVIASAPLAKFKTAFQMLAIFCLLIHYSYPVNYFGLITLEASFHRMGMALLYLSLFFSIASAIDYFWKFAKAINQRYEETQEPT